MASIVLGAAGAAIGSAVPFVGPIIGGALGSAIGGGIDRALGLGGSGTLRREGSRMADLSTQISTYGRAIPLVYGSVRVAGNVIWSRPIQETKTTSTSSAGGGKGGGGSKVQSSSYSYSATLAIALCEGPITGIVRVWADTQLLDLSRGSYRVYPGSETQGPDPLIESIEGIGKVPAYRGLAYVVIENFPLADYGNRIPNFTFEVKRRVQGPDHDGQTAENLIKSMIMIPGAGEFVYDTSIQQKIGGEVLPGGVWAESGSRKPINRNTPVQAADCIPSLDNLQAMCPNLEWIAVVATWFGTSLDAASCQIVPCVEYGGSARTTPNDWSVAGITRKDARVVTFDGTVPRYGGTPDDGSLVRYIAEVRRRGIKVLFLPMFFMDLPDKPWRGRVTGAPSAMANFFTKTKGYNAFILHYANLLKNRVDAFSIGSELIGLTSVHAGGGNFPAVSQLVALAGQVRAVMGSGTKLTYAADWSEYHHTAGGWYNLDPLWASPDIDVIGIDAYFPLTDSPQEDYDIQPVIDGWKSGEGWSYAFTDGNRTTVQPIEARYAWKNIDWFWKNRHVNPNGATTAWVPQSKKIWFTEYGFPSVDGATNQPNVFYDPPSRESFFPRLSRGTVDFRAQRLGIVATELVWQNSPMVERKFLWTWDARPHPYFPDRRDVWADGGVWITGHWVSGKLGTSSLGGVVRDLCLKAGLPESRFDVSDLGERVQGYTVNTLGTARERIDELMAAYFFDAVESDGVLRFSPRSRKAVAALTRDDLVAEEGEPVLSFHRGHEIDLPGRVDVLYLNASSQYQTGTQRAVRSTATSRVSETLNLPLVLSDSEARSVADATLQQRWFGRTTVRFLLDNRWSALEPTDVVTLDDGTGSYRLRIEQVLRDGGRCRIDAVADDAALYRTSVPAAQDSPGLASPPAEIPETVAVPLDLPLLPGDDPDVATLHFAAAGLGERWRGAVLYRSEDGSDRFERRLDLPEAAVIGTIVEPPGDYAGGYRIDEASSLIVRIQGGETLESVPVLTLLNGANLCLAGSELLQFRDATLLESGRYRLSGLLRGRFGTEAVATGHLPGERFVLLGSGIPSLKLPLGEIGQAKRYKAVSVGSTLGATKSFDALTSGRSLMPLSPVHLNATREPSGDLCIGWVRRARSGGWPDRIDLPLDERVERYRVRVVAAGMTKRTVEVEAPGFIYTSAMQMADFTGAAPLGTQVTVCQLSERAGAGMEARLTL